MKASQIGEVARVVHYLRKHLVGKRIANTVVQDDDIIYGKVGTSAKAFKAAMDGKTVLDARQQGRHFSSKPSIGSDRASFLVHYMLLLFVLHILSHSSPLIAVSVHVSIEPQPSRSVFTPATPSSSSCCAAPVLAKFLVVAFHSRFSTAMMPACKLIVKQASTSISSALNRHIRYCT